MDNTSDAKYLNCFTINDDIVYVPMRTRIALVTIYAILMIVTAVSNSLSIYANIKSKDWKNQSLRLVLYMSCCDVMYALFGYPATIVYILIPQYLHCDDRRIILFLIHIFFYISLYMVLHIATDRFLRVLLLERYKAIITPFRFNVILAFYLSAAVFLAFTTFFSAVIFASKAHGAQLSGPLNAIFVVITLILYIISIKKLRNHKKCSVAINSKTRNIARLATIFLSILSTTYFPLVMCQIFTKKIIAMAGDKGTVLIMHGLMIISMLNSPINAIAYLLINNRARRQILVIIRNNINTNNTRKPELQNKKTSRSNVCETEH